MADLNVIFYVTAYGVAIVVNQFAFFLIRKHHQNKPLGMETLLGQVTIFFTKVFASVYAGKQTMTIKIKI